MIHKNSYVPDQQEDSTSTPDAVADDSNFSGDEAEAHEVYTPSPKKSRGAQKKVVTVPIGEGAGSRSKGDVYPPPDSWSWRKYGQKPIKGSPYPRGYYRCSSSKGCPARKQVERSCLDPTLLLITYSCEHNHATPTTTSKHHYHHPTTTTSATNAAPPATTTTTSTSASSTTIDNIPVKFSPEEEFGVFTNPLKLDSDNSSSFNELTGELGWFSDLWSTVMLDSPALVGPTCIDADVAVMLTIGEEDQSLFGDLGELPECSVVFRRCGVEEITCCAGTG